MPSIKLNIADTIIELRSRLPMELPKPGERSQYASFIYQGNRAASVNLVIEAGNELLGYGNIKKVFSAPHPSDIDSGWSMFSSGNKYIIREQTQEGKLLAVVSKDFASGKVYKMEEGAVKSWKPEDIIYNLLHIMLVNYFSSRQGTFVHGAGIMDSDSRGVIFAGCSESGKSTMARIWYKNSNAQVFNDDRIIIRKSKGRFFLFDSPWYGEFNDFQKSNKVKAELKKIFFIYHDKTNKAKRLEPREAFKHFHPNIFPSFWSKADLSRQVDFCLDLTQQVPSYLLGFKEDKRVIPFVRSIQ